MARGRSVRALASLAALVAASSCSPEKDPPEPVGPEPDAGLARVELGVPGGDDGLEFVPLEAGGELRLQTFGQGGTHLFLGVRCVGFGNRAFVSITLTNLTSGAEVVSPAPVRPQLLLCREPSECDLVPLLAMASGIADMDEERDGLRIRVTADVRNQAGVAAEASQEAVLSTADL